MSTIMDDPLKYRKWWNSDLETGPAPICQGSGGVDSVELGWLFLSMAEGDGGWVSDERGK